ncbi:helix-turn-helix domain-containing protein [Providencia manganoxydans]|uniref:helix-turn-helix domain-containing protein n=1 Tax=Providencia manganoxydans TaxID=2923283 RepID=UPI0032DA62F4
MEKDWHPADIIAAIRKRGSTLSQISRSAGLSSSTLNNTLVRRWPKGERIIAEYLEMKPEEIWPSRYKEKNDNGISIIQ